VGGVIELKQIFFVRRYAMTTGRYYFNALSSYVKIEGDCAPAVNRTEDME
jgi:hypothetical protein